MRSNEFQRLLQRACKGTSVTTRDLVRELTLNDIASIKTGEIGLDYIKEIVSDLADSKDNESLYKVPIGKRDTQEMY